MNLDISTDAAAQGGTHTQHTFDKMSSSSIDHAQTPQNSTPAIDSVSHSSNESDEESSKNHGVRIVTSTNTAPGNMSNIGFTQSL
jgi:hypothetical protein